MRPVEVLCRGLAAIAMMLLLLLLKFWSPLLVIPPVLVLAVVALGPDDADSSSRADLFKATGQVLGFILQVAAQCGELVGYLLMALA